MQLKWLCVLFLLLSLFCELPQSQAQSISCTIVNSKTHQPVSFASIYSNNGDGTFSNQEGTFVLSILENAEDTFYIAECGYKTKAFRPITVMNNAKIEFLLSPLELNSPEKKITMIEPKELLQKALENYNINYVSDQQVYEVQLKQFSKVNDDYIRLMNANCYLSIPAEKKLDVKAVKICVKEGEVAEKYFVNPNYYLFNMQNVFNDFSLIKRLNFLMANYDKFDKKEITDIVAVDENTNAYKIVLEKKVATPDGGKTTSFELLIDRNTKAVVSIKINSDNGFGNETAEIVEQKKDTVLIRKPTKSYMTLSYRLMGNKWMPDKSEVGLTVSYQFRNMKTMNSTNFIQTNTNQLFFQNNNPVLIYDDCKSVDLKKDLFQQVKKIKWQTNYEPMRTAEEEKFMTKFIQN